MNHITPIELATYIGEHLQPLQTQSFTVRATLTDWHLSQRWARGTLVQHHEGVSTHAAASLRFGMAGWQAQRYVDQAAAGGQPVKSNVTVDVTGNVDYDPSFGLQFRATSISVVGESAQARRHRQVRQAIEGSGQGLNQGNLRVDFASIRLITMICPRGGNDGATDAQTTIEHALRAAGIPAPTIIAKPIPMSGPKALRGLETAVTEASMGTDLVLIVRGGGADDSMSMWNDHRLCTTLATCPKPIVLGIGHTQDQFNAHMVVHHAAATPTAAARWVSDRIRTAHQPAIIPVAPAPKTMPPAPVPTPVRPPQRSIGLKQVLIGAAMIVVLLVVLAIIGALFGGPQA